MTRAFKHHGAALMLALVATPAVAQAHDHSKMDHSKMDHSKMDHSKMDHSKMDHSKMDHSKMDHSKMDHSKMDHSSMDHSSMDHLSMDHSKMDHSKMDHAQRAGLGELPRQPIPVPTAADRAAAFPAIDHAAMQHASPINSMLLFNRLEQSHGQHGNGQAWEASGWLGGDIHRVWLRSEGERARGRTASADVELLYGRSVSPWWDVLTGVKQDLTPGDRRTWAALGIQGLAPYKFETQATLYVGSGGQVMANAEVEYEVLLTNRLILQPLLEATAAVRDDPGHGIGRGLNKVEAGLRLRYEFSRRFAPYIGISHERLFGDTADYRAAAGGHARDTRWVAGVRIWF